MNQPDTVKCLQCGRPTTRPKYCSDQCGKSYRFAAEFPARVCEHCRGDVAVGVRHCPTCLERAAERSVREREEAERQAREKEGYRTIVTQGGKADIQVPDVRLQLSMKWSFGLRIDAKTASCGELVAALIEIARTAPYVRDRDRRWLMSTLWDFMTFPVEERPYVEAWSAGPIGNIPLRNLGMCSYRWLWDSALSNPATPLSSSYALETLEFIVAHVNSWHFQSDRWELGELVVNQDHNRRGLIERVGKDEKRQVTSDVGGLVVRCAVPAGGRIRWTSFSTIREDLREFIFVIDRCHQSEKWTSSPWKYDFDAEEPEAEFELRHLTNFRFPGDILDARAGRALTGTVPAAWITHWEKPNREKDWREYGEADWIPVPVWLRGA